MRYSLSVLSVGRKRADPLEDGTALRLLLEGTFVDKGLHHGALGAAEGHPGKQNETLLDLEEDAAVPRFQAAAPVNKRINGNRPWRPLDNKFN
jgi:hypothetical protein